MILLFHESLLWVCNGISQKSKKAHYLTGDMFAY